MNMEEKSALIRDYVNFNHKTDLNIDELMYYMTWCDGKQFKKDIFSEERFTDEYVTGKFREFQNEFPYFLHSLSDNYKPLFCVAVHNFYINKKEDKE